jgi:hypothetical protein
MKRFVVLMLMVALFIGCAMSNVAFAADAALATQSALGSAVKDVVDNTIIPLLVALIGSLISIVLVKIKKKLNIQLSTETEAWIQRQAEAAVQMVAEKAASKIKYGNIALTKNEKLDMAIASLVSKVPHLTKEQADAYIHAALARIPGVGATGEQSLVAK